MSKGWKIFWWVIYAVQAFIGIASKVFACIAIILMAYEDSGPIIIRDDIPESDYKTSADFHKLTGVEFPELEIVDSLFFQDGGLSTNYWSEYTFVPKDGISKRFYKNLERMELFNHSSVAITKRYLGLRQEEIPGTYDYLRF